MGGRLAGRGSFLTARSCACGLWTIASNVHVCATTINSETECC